MTKFPLKAAGVLALLVGVSIVCLGWVTTGRMTGGGSVFITPDLQVNVDGGTDLERVTHGFEIHCGSEPAGDGSQVIPTPNNLEVNWPSANNFHMDTLTSADCECNPALRSPNPPSAGFNQFTGDGSGKLNGAAGATIHFVFTDQGEPGRRDTAAMTIRDPNGNIVLNFGDTNLTFGNQQAHDGMTACHGSNGNGN